MVIGWCGEGGWASVIKQRQQMHRDSQLEQFQTAPSGQPGLNWFILLFFFHRDYIILVWLCMEQNLGNMQAILLPTFCMFLSCLYLWGVLAFVHIITQTEFLIFYLYSINRLKPTNIILGKFGKTLRFSSNFRQLSANLL